MTKCVLFISFFHFSKQNVYSSCCCYSDEGGFGCMSSRCFSFLPDRELCAIVSRVWTWQFHYISSQTKWKNQTCFDSTALQRKLTRLFEKLLHCSSHFASSRVSNFIILLLVCCCVGKLTTCSIRFYKSFITGKGQSIWVFLECTTRCGLECEWRFIGSNRMAI